VPTPALRSDFVDERAPLPNELPAAEYNLNATRTDLALDTAEEAVAELATKVDQVAGKGLSTNDYTTAEKTKLGGVATGATANSTDAQLRDRATHTGTQSADTLTDGTTNKAYTAAEKTKLAGVATGATANATDAQLRDRSTHTGTQTSASISDWAEAVQDAVAAFLGAGSNVVVNYDDTANTLTISAPGGGTGGLTVEDVRDTIGAAIVGVGNITVAYNDALDTITISTTATVNSTDAALRDRSTHTGTQSADTIVDGTTNHVFTAADDTKLTGIATGATANATDAQLRDRSTHTGTQPISTITETATGKVMTDVERTKLAGIATGATANATDAQLRDRATHTGTQTAATISDLTESVQDIVGALLSGTTGVTVTYNDAANTLTVSGLGDASATAETIRDTIGVALVGTGLISVTANDALDTITITTTATANSTDAQLRDRSTHTGTQLAATISDFSEAVDDRVGALLADGTGIDVVYNDAGNIVTINATGGGAVDDYFQFLGAMAADTYVDITHNLGTMVIEGKARRTYLQAGALTSFIPGEVLDVDLIALTPNTARIKVAYAIAANEFSITLRKANAADVTGPTAGVLSSPSQTLTSITLALAGGTDAGVGNAGVNWYRNGVLIGTNDGSNFTHTGLTQGTTYDGYTAKRFDLNGTEGAVSNTLNGTQTLVPANVAPIGTVVEQRTTSTTATVRPVYVAGSLTIAVATVHINHNEWVSSANYTLSVNGTQSGAWTMVPEGNNKPDVGANIPQPSGGVHVFYKLSPSTSWTTDDVTVSKTAGSTITISQASIKIRQYQYVDQTNPFGTPTVGIAPVVGYGNSPFSVTIASNAGDYTLCVAGERNDATWGAPSGYNKTLVGTVLGGDTSGYNDWFLSGEAATATTGNVTHSCTGPSGAAYAVMAVNLKKA